jgi:hypothetical protein
MTLKARRLLLLRTLFLQQRFTFHTEDARCVLACCRWQFPSDVTVTSGVGHVLPPATGAAGCKRNATCQLLIAVTNQ